MRPALRPIGEQVIVITGGSSGIGRATAIEAARRGAQVVIAARGEEALEAARREIEAAGGQVLAVRADVADFAQVRELGRRAVERFGRIDTWVNNASVSIYAEFAQITPEEFGQVLQINLMGQVHGAMVALEHMKERGGAIVNVGSGLGDRAVPLQAPYSTSKFGSEGFSESLRTELEHGSIPVQVAVIKPSSINTPFFRHARTKTGVKPAPIPPVYDPALVAGAILHAAANPVRDLQVGSAAFTMALQQATPQLFDWFLKRFGYPLQQTDEPKAVGQDNLFTGAPGPGAIRGEFGGTRFSPYTWLRLHPQVRNAALGGLALAGLAVARRRAG